MKSRMYGRTSSLSALCCIATTALTAAQESRPTTRPHDPAFEEFVRAVDAAHRRDSGEETFDQFKARLTIQRQLEQDGEPANIDVRLVALFMQPDLLRYEVEEEGRGIERGVDARGAWAKTNEGRGAYPLAGREFASERAEVRRHVRLARQLLRFLDPAASLRTLRDPDPVEDRELRIGRLPSRDCRYVAGTIEDFPMFTSDGDSERVRLGVWTEHGLVAAVEATPLGEDGEPAGASELVVLDDYADYDGLAAPSHLTVYRVGDAPRRPELLAKIAITDLDLAPELRAESFTRPPAPR